MNSDHAPAAKLSGTVADGGHHLHRDARELGNFAQVG
jgi:hypothetical protein